MSKSTQSKKAPLYKKHHFKSTVSKSTIIQKAPFSKAQCQKALHREKHYITNIIISELEYKCTNSCAKHPLIKNQILTKLLNYSVNG